MKFLFHGSIIGPGTILPACDNGSLTPDDGLSLNAFPGLFGIVLVYGLFRAGFNRKASLFCLI
jgi:hypothetical protein